ncbi:hypothetical protein AAFF_G00414930 [Aldrovandia affinis]|uniref:Uncharacterized protein n=1 Tax=Aldrovandia affinis TaxID=143900 RepID=A0AAD7SAT6_9TELE|nr:hypothetical protein AAFF_G00414930 [Aldrovandia affinis]
MRERIAGHSLPRLAHRPLHCSVGHEGNATVPPCVPPTAQRAAWSQDWDRSSRITARAAIAIPPCQTGSRKVPRAESKRKTARRPNKRELCANSCGPACERREQEERSPECPE